MPDTNRIRGILDAGRAMFTELDPSALLLRAIETGRVTTGATHAAVLVLDAAQEEVTEVLLTAAAQPEGWAGVEQHGIVRDLLAHPRPLNVMDPASHPAAAGQPFGAPGFDSVLAVPVLLADRPHAILVFAERSQTPFSADSADLAARLAEWVAVALENHLLYRDARARQIELSRVNRGLATTTSLTRALAGEMDLQRVVDLVASRARSLVGARAAVVSVVAGEDNLAAAVAGEARAVGPGRRVKLAGSLGERILATRRPRQYLADSPEAAMLWEPVERSALLIPLMFKDRAVGVLGLYDPPEGAERFSDDEITVLEAYGASAATAIANAQSATEEALRKSILASESERSRWARELHDETLQELAALRVLLSGARRTGDMERLNEAIDHAVSLVTDSVANLRSLITDLRPAALDELGVEPALEALVARVSAQADLVISLDVSLAYERGEEPERNLPEVEATVYRVVQEALTNIVKHARAAAVWIRVDEREGSIILGVRDDGRGFDTGERASGFGLLGMRERIALVDGTLEVVSTPGEGTEVRARVPGLRRAPEPQITAR